MNLAMTQPHRRSKFFLNTLFLTVLFCAGIYVPSAICERQPLKELLASPELRSVAPRSVSPLPKPAWLDPDSSYAQFYFKPGFEALRKILGDEFPGYKIVRPDVKVDPQFIEVIFDVHHTASHQKFLVRLYLPHPSLLALAEQEALPRQLLLIPSKSSVTSSSDLVIKEDTLNVTTLQDQSFILSVKLPMQGTLFLTSPTQAAMKDAIEFYRLLDIAELKHLLTS